MLTAFGFAAFAEAGEGEVGEVGVGEFAACAAGVLGEAGDEAAVELEDGRG